MCKAARFGAKSGATQVRRRLDGDHPELSGTTGLVISLTSESFLPASPSITVHVGNIHHKDQNNNIAIAS